MVKILVVDDNAMVRAMLRNVLERAGKWAVIGEAENGARAVEKVHEGTFDVTVMDFIMPEMNGLEAAREISKDGPKGPILMVTSDPSRQLEEEAKKVGIRGLCSKSDVRCLLKAVETVLLGGTYFRFGMGTA
jgi:two-component system chemotaxis response regulator CheY